MFKLSAVFTVITDYVTVMSSVTDYVTVMSSVTDYVTVMSSGTDYVTVMSSVKSRDWCTLIRIEGRGPNK